MMVFKIVVGAILAAFALLFFDMVYPFLHSNDDFKITRVDKIDQQYSFAYINEEDYDSIYVLNKYEVEHFKRNKDKQPLLVLKRIYWDDIYIEKKKIKDQNVYIIHIKYSAYIYGRIIHFQNYFWKDGFKKINVFLDVDK